MSITSDERIPLLSIENDEEETREKQLFEYVEPNVILAPPTCETEYLDIHKEDSSVSVNQELLQTDTTEGSETNLKHAIIDIENSFQNRPRKLPDGKKYHLFVSFCRDDEDLVIPIVKKLEEEGLRCMLDGRDFIGGKGIIENIVDALKDSQKILLMMTPNFVESGPCMFEQRQAIHIFNWMEKRSNCSIPVLLRPCDIPAHLKNLTYIDAETAEKDSSLIAKIIESYDLNDTVEYFMPDNMLHELRLQLRQLPIKVNKYINGTVVTKAVPSKTQSGILGSQWQFKELTDRQREELGKAKIQDAERVYEEIRKKLNSCIYMRMYGIFNWGSLWCASCMWINLLYIAWVCAMIVTIAMFQKRIDIKATIAVIIILPITGCCVYPCFTNHISRKAMKYIISTLYIYGKRTCLDGKFLIIKQSWPSPNECIERKFKTIYPNDSQNEISVGAKTVLEHSLSANLYNVDFNWINLPVTDERRHEVPMLLDRCCLCELAGIEMKDNSVMPEVESDDIVIV